MTYKFTTEGCVNGDYGNCGVHACAVFLGFDPWETMQHFAKRFSKSKNWLGRTTLAERRTFIREVTGTTVIQAKWKRKGRVNLKTFVEWHTKPGISYMVTCGNHVVVIRNGLAIDQHETSAIEDHPARRKHVKHAMWLEN